MISSRFSTPSPVSILAITMTSSRPSTVRVETMSKAERTNETARISNSSPRSAARRSRSSSVGRRSLRIDDGSESPGLPSTAPPEVTTARTCLPEETTSSETPPSPRWTASPARRSARTPSRSTTIRDAVDVSPNPSHQLDLAADGEVDRAHAEAAGADLGTGQVDHQGQVGRQQPDLAHPRQVGLDVPVGEGEAEDVDPGGHQRLDDPVAPRRPGRWWQRSACAARCPFSLPRSLRDPKPRSAHRARRASGTTTSTPSRSTTRRSIP